MMPNDLPDHILHQQRRGLLRLWHAALYSLQGLRTAWLEPAFQAEVLMLLILLPTAFWLGRSWVETAVLISAVVLVLVVEVINTALEAAINRIGPEWHEFSKQAKDLGSAAVLLSLLLCLGVWGSALYQRLLA